MRVEKGKRVRVYLTELDRRGGHDLARLLVERLRSERALAAIVFRGLEGFGLSQRLHASLVVDAPPESPLVVEWIDRAERVDALLPDLALIAAGALVCVDALDLVPGTA